MASWKRISALVLCILFLFGLTACGSERSQITDTISRFESACKTPDFEEILACLDPEISTPIHNSVTILGALTNTNVAEALDNLIPYIFSSNRITSDALSSLNIKVNTIDVAASSATAHCTITFLSNDEKFASDADISLIKTSSEKPAWRISNISFQ